MFKNFHRHPDKVGVAGMQLDRKNKLFIHGKWLEHTKTEHDDESENFATGSLNRQVKVCTQARNFAVGRWVGVHV